MTQTITHKEIQFHPVCLNQQQFYKLLKSVTKTMSEKKINLKVETRNSDKRKE